MLSYFIASVGPLPSILSTPVSSLTFFLMVPQKPILEIFLFETSSIHLHPPLKASSLFPLRVEHLSPTLKAVCSSISIIIPVRVEMHVSINLSPGLAQPFLSSIPHTPFGNPLFLGHLQPLTHETHSGYLSKRA